MVRCKPIVAFISIFCIGLIDCNSFENYDERVPISVNSFRFKDELSIDYHMQMGKEFVKKQHTKTNNLNLNKAKNLVLFLGDGMSVPTLAATRVYIGGEKESLSFEKFPFVAMSKTYCVDYQVADSSCSATAYLTGVKGNLGTAGVSAKVKRSHCTAGSDKETHTPSIAQWAAESGKSIGLVTTTTVTHASPSGVYAHIADRNWESNNGVVKSNCDDNLVDDIAEQLVHGETGSRLQVVFGGGRGHFIDRIQLDEEGNFGFRTDRKNLIREWLNKKKEGESRRYVWNKNGLLSLEAKANESVLGLFAPSHLKFNHEVDGFSDTMPTLSEMVLKAIDILSKNENGFFLFVEGGRIDHGHHYGQPHIALDETAEFSRAIQLATDMLGFEDTLHVVTADHAHTMTLSGYPSRGSNIFGVAGRSDMDYLPYLKLSYANGAGYAMHKNSTARGRSDPTSSVFKLNDFQFKPDSTVPLSSESHGGDDVVCFAAGPHSHLFTGSIEQNVIPHLMAYAGCIGKGITACNAHTFA